MAKSAAKKVATKKAPAKKAAAKKVATKKAATNGARGGRQAFADETPLRVIGKEHGRREGSRYHTNYGYMGRAKTVGEYRKLGGQQDSLRDAIKEGYVKVG